MMLTSQLQAIGAGGGGGGALGQGLSAPVSSTSLGSAATPAAAGGHSSNNNTNSSNGESARTSYTAEEWTAKLDEVRLSKSDLDSLVMNYLIVEGYESAARKFSQEANIQHPIESFESIEQRRQIRCAIHRGDIQDAISRINEMNPRLLDRYPALQFSLLRLHLISLILQSHETNQIEPVLTFATSHLAPRAIGNPVFLTQLEETMALLCFPPGQIAEVIRPLVDPSLRRDVANTVNKALMENIFGAVLLDGEQVYSPPEASSLATGANASTMQQQHQQQQQYSGFSPGEARIASLVRLYKWAEERLPTSAKAPPSFDAASGTFHISM